MPIFGQNHLSRLKNFIREIIFLLLFLQRKRLYQSLAFFNTYEDIALNILFALTKLTIYKNATFHLEFRIWIEDTYDK